MLKDKDHKKALRMIPYKAHIKKEFSKLKDKADYALVIHPDFFPKQFVKYIAGKSNYSVGYQWDGFNRYPEVSRYIDLFDKFFAFDPVDINPKKKVFPASNFYFDYDEAFINKIIEKQKSIYFLGGFQKDRINTLLSILKLVNKLNYESFIYLFTRNSKVIQEYKESNINFIAEQISYTDNLIKISQASVLIDFSTKIHNGLSFRCFEAIGLQKKLIIDNPTIKKYDFYNPNNIFVWGSDKVEDLEAFLLTDYEPLPEGICKKYSFTNWLHYVLDIEPYQKIELPKID